MDNPAGLPTDSHPFASKVNTALQPSGLTRKTRQKTYTYPFLRDKVYGFA